jgi:hypothetical protein
LCMEFRCGMSLKNCPCRLAVYSEQEIKKTFFKTSRLLNQRMRNKAQGTWLKVKKSVPDPVLMSRNLVPVYQDQVFMAANNAIPMMFSDNDIGLEEDKWHIRNRQ